MTQMQLFTIIFPLATEKQVKPVQIWSEEKKKWRSHLSLSSTYYSYKACEIWEEMMHYVLGKNPFKRQ